MKRLYGIRGAITAENNKESITEKTVEMCSLIFNENKLLPEEKIAYNNPSVSMSTEDRKSVV